MAFVHLHVHTEYSLLDGACRIGRACERAAELGQTALAITDHGVMYGVIDFYRAAQKAGIKPIIGCEVYVAPRTRTDRVHELDAEARHLVLLCRNEEGYRNLCTLVSRGFTEGFYIKPRVDMELLRQHAGGLIALSACLAGEIPRRLLAGDYAGAKAHALEMREIFGADGYYLELQDHGIAQQREIISGVARLHDETGIPLVATNDAHYIRRSDAPMQDVLLCIQTAKTVDDPDRMRFEAEEFYLKSEEEMAKLFPNYPDALENTAKIAALCNVDFEFGKHHLPEFRMPPGQTDRDAYFAAACEAGFARRYPTPPEGHHRRLQDEMDMIRRMGFVDYFLIVADFIGYAKGRDIPVGPGRGSAAGSMVSYCLDITDVDPMKYGLYFERFLNPDRVTMPDIDIDFCIRRRQEVIDYVSDKYGADHVAQIVTFGSMKARAAIRDVARALSVPYAEADAVAKAVPFSLGMTLEQALKLSKSLREMYDTNPKVHEVVDTAMALEGMPRNASTHAAGVVITRRPVHEYVPLATNEDTIVTQYTMNTLEELGLLKMDFLGLRNLTVLDDAVQLVRAQLPDFTLADIPDDDAAVFQMLSDGRTSGVFQMESAGMTGVCTGLKPRSIEDITAIIALYRPGPMDSIPRFVACAQNPKLIRYLHPSLKPILDVTYGCIVYQEQVIEIFRRLGGFSLGQADMVRRAISKKKAAEIAKERQSFIHGDPTRGIVGAVANGIDEATAENIYDDIFDFANYAFNKAHAVSYAVVAYQTAWFKYHYPRQYMAALLTSVLDSQDKVAEYIAECKAGGILLLPPDVNESGAAFTVSGQHLRFGLAALKGVGRGFTDALIAERARGGLFTSFEEFCTRMFGVDLNRRVVESLIKCGAFDSLGARRSQLLAVSEAVLDAIGNAKRKSLEGQFDLFGGGGEEGTPVPRLELPNIAEFSAQERMRMEKETTGLYLSGHPMDAYRTVAKLHKAVPIGSITADFAREDGPVTYADEQKVTVAGVVGAVKTKTTRNNTMMAYLTLEDDTGSIECLVFQRVLNEAGPWLKDNQPILLTGRISVRDEKAPQLLADSVRPMSEQEQPAATPRTLYLKIPSEDSRAFSKVKSILNLFPGSERALLVMADTGRKLATACAIDDILIPELRDVLGDGNVVVK